MSRKAGLEILRALGFEDSALKSATGATIRIDASSIKIELEMVCFADPDGPRLKRELSNYELKPIEQVKP